MLNFLSFLNFTSDIRLMKDLDSIKKLHIMQLFEIGIPDNIYHYLSKEEQEMLEERNGRINE
jgi:hypothetical protein